MKKTTFIIVAAAVAACAISCNKSSDFSGPDYPPELIEKVSEGEAVDLGLSVKWCSRNLGASSVQDPGGLYTWQSMTNYKTKASLNPEDPATAILGEDYRCPTKAELNELISSCTLSFKTYKGRPGLFAKGPNGASIFLPCGGGLEKTTDEWIKTDFYGRYWSCEADEGNPLEKVWALYFSASGASVLNNYQKINSCCSIRAVFKAE